MSLPLWPSLLGATASGKTAVAVEAAQRAGLEILSADSRQIYRRMDIGTAKPTREERDAAPHHLIDLVDPEETCTAARFGDDARRVAEDVRVRGRIPFLVGGSGLYLRSAESGLFEGPPPDPDLRARYERIAAEQGGEALRAMLAEVDAETAERLAPADHGRIIRALEVREITGIALSEHHRRHQAQAPRYRFLRFGIEWPTVVLNRRIERRIRQMLDAGWMDEVKSLIAGGLAPTAPAWNALGYPEIRACLEGKIAEAEVAERVEVATKQFAKRQRTWFRSVPDVRWFKVGSEADLLKIAEPMAEQILDAEAAR